jgi:hypothetical protein
MAIAIEVRRNATILSAYHPSLATEHSYFLLPGRTAAYCRFVSAIYRGLRGPSAPLSGASPAPRPRYRGTGGESATLPPPTPASEQFPRQRPRALHSTACARRTFCAGAVACATSCSRSGRCFAVSTTSIARPMPHWTGVRHLDLISTALHLVQKNP